MLTATIRGMLAHKLRLILTATSIALGVAFLSGTLMLSSSMQRAFDDLFASVEGGSDTVVRAVSDNDDQVAENERPPVPVDVLDKVMAVGGVATAEGRVEGYALITDSDGKPIQPNGAPTVGTNLSVDPGLRGDIALRSGHAPRGPDQVVVDASSAKKGDLEIGSTVRILFRGADETFTVVGIAGFGDADDLGGSTTAFFELPTAQRLMGETGVFDTIVIEADDGVTPEELTDRVGSTLPGGLEALTGDAVAAERAADVKDGLGFFTTMLIGFAGIALFVGSFIIWNTFSMQVAQRTRELALLRAIGATRRQVLRTILTEAVVLGAAASAIGVVLGVALAHGLSSLFEVFGFTMPALTTALEPRTVLVGLLVGTLTTVVAAVSPARRATRVLPVEALRDAAPTAHRSSRLRIAIGAVLTTGGVAGMLLALLGSASAAVLAVGVVAATLGVTTLAPVFMRALAAVVGWPLRAVGMPGALARQNAMRNPKRTASTAMALVIGLTLVVTVSVFAASLKASFSDVLTRSTNADLYVLTPTSQSPGFSPEVVTTVRQVDGVEIVSPTGFGTGRFAGDNDDFTSVDPVTVEAALDLGMVEGDAGELSDDGVLVREDLAAEHGWSVGDTIPGDFPGGRDVPLEIQGIYDGKGFVNTAYTVTGAAHTRFYPQRLEGTTVVIVEDGADVAAVQSDVEAAIADRPDATVMDQEEFQGAMSSVIDQMVGLVTVMLMLAVVIALLGIVNTLALAVFERTRELGLLRAVGMTRRQVRAMVRWESVVISSIGALLGVGLGTGLGLALVKAVEDQGIERIAVPGSQVMVYVAAAALAGVVAAIAPARRASNVDVLRAVVSD
ncbi:MAG TPA: FtsX-like permease family protein [Nocardioidaceae bacterium]|nr:FtsX-like permease family protein [Nocardioidaceae bacterium]